ncbi:hypothetical protein BC793_15423 [Actinoplanes xinjiangensis]|uniref:Uncharacterized protein n=1 Tax=Actinoplanes xinjiangensis TaxID=512350 RepID=A0A316EAM9_9ACTN|nr:hypothetical protein BC793_15423 [Actinoplanes xinjiangensis]
MPSIAVAVSTRTSSRADRKPAEGLRGGTEVGSTA